VVDLSLLSQLSDTALTSEREIEMNAGGLPNTFVPVRNLSSSPSRRASPTGAA
jgi:7-cyano-7-deazaguanine synthase